MKLIGIYIMHSELENIDFNSFSIFEDFDSVQIQSVLDHSYLKNLDTGAVLIQPDEPNDTLYLLISGELRIVIENKGSNVSFPILPGECLGEISLVLEQPTSARASVQSPSRVICIPEEIFWKEIAGTRKGIRNLMATMAVRLRRANHALIQGLEAQLKYQQLEKDLETAGKIQSSIVPPGSNLLPQCTAIDSYALIKQAREVGGDFYDAILLDEERIYIAIGDVSGKGMPAALFMMRIFTSLRMSINKNLKFDKVISSVNELLSANNDDVMFVSLFTGILNIKTGAFQYINCGHNPPFISISGKDFLPLPGGHGPLLGIDSNAVFSIGNLVFKKGDVLVMYTDGVSEAMNLQGDMFEMNRVQKLLTEKRTDSMQGLIKMLQNEVDDFVGEAPQHDDFTVFAFKYLGP